MQTVQLSTLLNRMDAFQKIANIEEQYKVRHLDSALRDLKLNTKLPWALKKSTMRVFDRVYEYPVADDHDALAYLDNNNQFATQDKARFFFTSLQQFYENQTYRNLIAEIFDRGTRYLGVRYKDFNFGSQQIDDASSIVGYSGSGDASNPLVDNVFYHSIDDNAANSSISFDVVNNTNVAGLICNFTKFGDANYRRKYFFVDLYLPFMPTSVELRFGNDSSDYLSSGNLITQFSGQSIKTGDWNIIAFDLNEPASTVGTVDIYNFNYFEIVLNGAPTGKYYVGQSWVREWDLLDYYYYSTYNVKSNLSPVPDQELFYDDSTQSYDLASSLVCDSEFDNVVMYEACLLSLADVEDKGLIALIQEKRDNAWDKMLNEYPNMKPVIITQRYNFSTDYGVEGPGRLNY